MRNLTLALVYSIAFAWVSIAPADPIPGMSEAFFIGAIAIVAAVTSMITSITSAALQAKSAKDTASVQKRIARNNAVAQQRTQYAEEARRRKLNDVQRRRMRENLGKSGVRSDVGTGLDIQVQMAGEMEYETIEFRQIGAYNRETQLESSLAVANADKQAGYLGAAATGIQGVAQAGSIISGAANAGAFSKQPAPAPASKGR